MKSTWTMTAAILCGLVPNLGCSSKPSDAPIVAAVSGTVTIKGQPLPSGEIVFFPAKGRSARGEIKDGKIQDVTTTSSGDGVTVGDVRVAIFSQVKDEKDLSGMGTKSLINVKYNDPATSNFAAKIEAGKVNEVKFDLPD